jgi:hypothetical protein
LNGTQAHAFTASLPRQLARAIAALLLAALCLGAYQSPEGQAPAGQTALTADLRAALDRISADSLRGHLSFIASDLLEGRNTPSRGLDIAAHRRAIPPRRTGTGRR